MARSRPAAAPAPDNGAAESASHGGLVYVSDDQPGLRRIRAGRGFRYVDPQGRTVRDAGTLARIRALAIPPAYRDVWICLRPNGHLQASGRDARGRKQYRYHPRWKQVRDARKFDRIVAFAAALPRLRRVLRRDLAREGVGREKVVALVVAVLADTRVRVGNAEYQRDNRSYGLTTLRNRHVEFLRGGRAHLRFRGKGGQEHDAVLDDARLTRLVRRCQQLPGQLLFQYVDDAGNVQPVDSGLVNDYLRESMGDDFTAKDFRTWGGTLDAIQRLARCEVPMKDDGTPHVAEVTSLRNGVIAEVAAGLGNTPAVCRASYIDPLVFECWEDGRLQRAVANARGERQWEQAALRLLRRGRRRAR
ncbi:DNA topoisomerase IB [Lysobacter sp. LF1]|uniref:DNA topoisomerase IB n=1 Tax=Lysobacter stagni TaxID=3045172 RepID=A0ABT6XHP8_9GAMM|nr:DNA topoisomerase IB [Lysobacter sp. LF1]MDI9239672.1 DNA topoisomerase IB [Lysobacter sp. LF1]